MAIYTKYVECKNVVCLIIKISTFSIKQKNKKWITVLGDSRKVAAHHAKSKSKINTHLISFMIHFRSRCVTRLVDMSCFFWHSTPGPLNDINVLQRLPMFHDICEGRVPLISFNVNDNTYHMGYYLTDGIYYFG